MKPDSDYTAHAICINGLLMGIMMTKHQAIAVGEALYKGRDYEVVQASRIHYSLLKV